ncbi:MAG: hypothetical protein WD005_03660 [Haliea sp.]
MASTIPELARNPEPKRIPAWNNPLESRLQTIHISGPVLAQILLTPGVYMLLGRRKFAAVKADQVDRNATALDNEAWPEAVIKISNNLANPDLDLRPPQRTPRSCAH